MKKCFVGFDLIGLDYEITLAKIAIMTIKFVWQNFTNGDMYFQHRLALILKQGF